MTVVFLVGRGAIESDSEKKNLCTLLAFQKLCFKAFTTKKKHHMTT